MISGTCASAMNGKFKGAKGGFSGANLTNDGMKVIPYPLFGPRSW